MEIKVHDGGQLYRYKSLKLGGPSFYASKQSGTAPKRLCVSDIT